LILWGEKDPDIPVADGHLYTKASSGSNLLIYTDTGHFTHEEVADQSLEEAGALEKLTQLARYGRYRDSIIEDARRKLEAKP
jgi:pimeloyl-ACP methyl ester carboxylesterase